MERLNYDHLKFFYKSMYIVMHVEKSLFLRKKMLLVASQPTGLLPGVLSAPPLAVSHVVLRQLSQCEELPSWDTLTQQVVLHSGWPGSHLSFLPSF